MTLSNNIGLPQRYLTVLLKRGEMTVLLHFDFRAFILYPYFLKFLQFVYNHLNDGTIYQIFF